MAEPRARGRTRGQVFAPDDLASLLYAYGDNVRTRDSPAPLQTTIQTLDEILTDFIIETCHYAALSASYSRRQKIKVDDFKFVLRRDERLLGKVLEQLWREKRMREQRKIIEMDGVEGSGAAAMSGLEGVAAAGGVTVGEMKEKKRGRGRGKRKRAAGEDGGGARATKRVAS
jgi:transcription initiation factor TFIID subunit 13